MYLFIFLFIDPTISIWMHCCYHQVCGGHSDATANGSCPDSRCGGAGCRDDQGNRVCGGEGCNGTLSTSAAALNLARNVSDSLNAASEEMQSVAKKVLTVFTNYSRICLVTIRFLCWLDFLVFWIQLLDIASLTNDVKNQAINTLNKAQQKKDDFEKNNKELKDFIKKIRDFLTGIIWCFNFLCPEWCEFLNYKN